MLALFVHAVSAALLPFLVWVALVGAGRRLDPSRSQRVLFIAAAVGTLAALVVAVLEQTTSWISRELLALWLLPAAIVLALAGPVWLWWPTTAGRARPRWGRGVLGVLAALVGVAELPDLFVLVAAIVPHGASPLTTDALGNAGGYLSGVATVGLSAWAVHRASVGAGGRMTQVATSIVLLLLGLGQLVSLMRMLIVRGLVDPPSWLFDAVVAGLNSQWLATAGITLACLLPVGSALRSQRAARDGAANPAETRLRRAGALSRRRFVGLAGLGLGLTVVALTAGRAAADTEPTLSAPEPLASDDRNVWVAVSAIDDGHLHRFAYPAQNGTEVRFIAIRKSTNAFVAALDACNICGPAGYYESGGRVICKMCGVAMNIATIGFAGGCNPIPIAYSVTGGNLLVARKVLEANVKVFE